MLPMIIVLVHPDQSWWLQNLTILIIIRIDQIDITTEVFVQSNLVKLNSIKETSLSATQSNAISNNVQFKLAKTLK